MGTSNGTTNAPPIPINSLPQAASLQDFNKVIVETGTGTQTATLAQVAELVRSNNAGTDSDMNALLDEALG